MTEHTYINNLHPKVRYMGKTLYGKYVDDVINIRVYLTVCFVLYLWVPSSYHFQAIFFTKFHVEAKGKVKTFFLNKLV